ncbi:hypothetical protein G6030_01875 [Dietzia sp. E1]|uniref:hypothetical protein n=1 Tax=Dietzia sp. E1 TaxID=328361 RepID=UPI0015F7F1E0|nr:hypothetical protein [Dietzia sp. E1]MBB1020057.1 hypothetical protein [Dietzia sp. E1]
MPKMDRGSVTVSAIRVSPFILLFYGVYTLVALAVAYTTTLSLSDVLPAILLMWALSGVFFVGELVAADRSLNRGERTPQRVSSWGAGPVIAVALIAAVMTIASVTYYSGATPSVVWSNLTSGNSLYLDYQEFNSDFGASGGVVGRVFVVLRVLSQLLTLYFFFTFAVVDRNLNWYRVTALVILGFASLYGSLARGTTFEAFKLVLLVLFVLYARGVGSRRRFRGFAIAGALSLAVFYFFRFNIAARGARQSECLSLDVCRDSAGAFGPVISTVADVAELLYGYFGHGFFYISTMLNRVVPNDLGGIQGWLVPENSFWASGSNALAAVENIIDMGPRWRPDSAIAIATYGFIGLIFIVALLGLIAGLLSRDRGPAGMIGLFVIVVQVLSLPVGNFVTVSTEYVAAVVMCGAWYLYSFVSRSRTSIAPRGV